MKALDTLPIRVYSPAARPRSVWGALRQAAGEIHATREIIWGLFLRDLTVQYRQRLLGCLWAFLTPLLTVATFVFLYYAGILRAGETPVPYPLYVFMGTFLWGTFVIVVQSVSGALVQHGDLILRTGVPKISLLLSSFGNVLFNLVLQLVTLAGMLALFRVTPSWGALLYPLLIVPMLCFGLCLALLLATFGTMARDLTTMVVTFLNFLLYLTPVVYNAQFEQPVLKALVKYNPFTYLIDGPRTFFFSGSMPDPGGYALASLLSVAALALGVRCFYFIQDQIAERL